MTSAPFHRVSFALPKGEMTGVSLGDRSRPPDLIFLHATGFNALTYRALLAPLAERMHVLALDLRGHGRTTLPNRRLGYASWNRHRNDLVAVMETGIKNPAVFAGHSMGGTTALLLAGARPDLVRGLCLIDPVIVPATTRALMQAPGAPLFAERAWKIARKAAARRSLFETPEAAFQALKGRGVFKAFSDETLTDYLTDGLTAVPEGGVRLSCAPAFEARTFAAQRHNPWAAWLRANAPLVVLRAEHGSTCPEWAAKRLAMLRPEARIARIDGAGHMLPMERPDRVRAGIESAFVMSGKRAGAYREVL